MNLKQLSAFREVMLTGSVSEAARNLSRTQPAISAMIAGLESDVGFALFTRRGGRLHPVPEAHYLMEEATEILNRLDSTRRIMQSVRDLEQGTLRIVAMPGPSVFLLPALISRFVAGREGIKVSLISRSSPQVQQLVSVQQYDLGLADLGSAAPGDSALVTHDIERFECLCALPANDPLARQAAITAADLSGKPMATLYTDHPTFAQTKAAFAAMGAEFNASFETQYFIPLLTFVERALAYAVIDPLSAESYRLYRQAERSVVFRPFSPKVYFLASIITPAHRPLSNLAQAFTASLKQEIRRIKLTSTAGPSGASAASRVPG